VGESFKRKRARAFKNLRHDAYQKLVDVDLFRLSRKTRVEREILCRCDSNDGTLAVGDTCLLLEAGDTLRVVHGNTVVVTLAKDAAEFVRETLASAPTFNGMVPCRVTRIDPFGGLSLQMGSEAEDARK
jgi:hypothetical protein